MLVLTTLLSGCAATRLAYNQAPRLTYWWLDGFADFDSSQDDKVREELASFFRWHRSTQLPDYVQLLVKAQAQVQSTEPMQPAQVCAWIDDIFARANPLAERAIPQIATIVPLLKPAQFRHMERKQAKENAKYRDDFLQPDPADRREAALERITERAETLYGRLEAAQKAALMQQVAASPFDPELWLAERQHRQREVVATLRRLHAERASPDQTQAALRALLANARHSPREAYRQYDERLREYNCGMAARLHNSITPKQRQHALRKLKGWEDDLRSLAAEVK